MSARNALVLTVLACVLALAAFASAEEKKPEAAPLPGDDPRDAKVEEQLATLKVSFEFNEQPIPDAVEFLQSLSKVNLVVDKAKLGDPPKTVTLKLKDVPLGTALKLLTEQAGLTYVIYDGLVYISDAEGARRPSVRAMYDVVDLLKARPGLKVKDPDEALNDLIDVIKQTIEPGTWDEGGANSIRGLDGTLIVTHTGPVHREVRKLLSELRRIREADAKAH